MEAYKRMISEINNAIKPLGFKKKGDTFFYTQENNLGLINFQKSNKSSSESITFTINAGVYSNSLHILDSPGMESKPSLSDCHWLTRVGFLLPENKDFWWYINSNTVLSDLKDEIIYLLTSVVIPEIKKHISDDSLLEDWMKGISSGLTEPQMYLYLIGMLKQKNSNILHAKVAELKALSKGKSFERNVRESLMGLGIDV